MQKEDARGVGRKQSARFRPGKSSDIKLRPLIVSHGDPGISSAVVETIFICLLEVKQTTHAVNCGSLNEAYLK
jgi:hypothetical protein